MKRPLALVPLALLLLPLAAHAQPRGRTDGPEGSEIGRGGYRAPGAERFSLELGWGASLPSAAPLQAPFGPPLFASLTASFWSGGWLLFDVGGHYDLASDAAALLVGPRVRTAFHPLSVSVGLKAGPYLMRGQGVRFALSPQLGGDLRLGRALLVGLGYALDVPVGGDPPVVQRLYMNVGCRF